jgi:Asp-tRNA(Asn)/Glu-tRNA(Gln) amidotransferase A subunit family amidase
MIITEQAWVIIARIEQAGAIILGKTNSPIMGFRGTWIIHHYPQRRQFDLKSGCARK